VTAALNCERPGCCCNDIVSDMAARAGLLLGFAWARLLGGQGDGALPGFLAGGVEGMGAIDTVFVFVVGKISAVFGVSTSQYGGPKQPGCGCDSATHPGRSPRPLRGSGGVQLEVEPARNLRLAGRSMAMGRLCRGDLGW
jgi:hypothetical protein